MAGNLLPSNATMFKNLLYLDVVRGEDSTGVAVISRNAGLSSVELEKTIGHPQNLWEYSETDLFDWDGEVSKMTAGGRIALIGHNRAATLGKITEENAHPFTFRHITGAHNGTLTDWYDLEGFKEFDVDSKALFNHISMRGIEDAWKSFSGAAAITYWNDETQTINIIRNKHRTLYYCYTRAENCVIWASEPWMITVSAAKAKKDLKEKSKGVPDIHMFEEDHLYTFKPTLTDCPLVSKTEMEKKNSVIRRGGNYTMGTGYSYQGYTGFKSKSQEKSKRKKVKINNGWASGLPKGGKEIRKKEGKLTGVSCLNSDNKYATLELNSGETVRVYPQHEEDYQKWVSWKIHEGEYFFRLNARPRVVLDSKGKFKCYAIAHNYVSMTKHVKTPTAVEDAVKSVVPLYRGSDRRLCTEEQWKEDVKGLGMNGCCSNCLNPLDINDHEEILWVDRFEAYCPDCKRSNIVVQHLYAERGC